MKTEHEERVEFACDLLGCTQKELAVAVYAYSTGAPAGTKLTYQEWLELFLKLSPAKHDWYLRGRYRVPPKKNIARSIAAELGLSTRWLRKIWGATKWVLLVWAFLLGAMFVMAALGLPVWAVLYLIYWTLA
jgi:hypothetical protein